jgi:pyruvate dehydrogenase E2 component (dihydrolipoamide acetyltransferase)
MVPDIGDFDEVEVIEVLVNAGDELSAEDSIITWCGRRYWCRSCCDWRFFFRCLNSNALNIKNQITQFNFVTYGDFDEVEVIEVLVNAGDGLSAEDSIITLESDKASMEIPTPIAGKVIDINVTLGDKIKLGDLILNIESAASSEEVVAEMVDTFANRRGGMRDPLRGC